MTGRIVVARNPLSRTKAAVAFCTLVLLASFPNEALAQGPTVTTTAGASSTSGQAAPPAPAIPTQPTGESSQRQTAQSEGAVRNRPPNQAGTRTPELTDFQQFVAQSLGYPLPIYGATLFENSPTTFAPVDRIPVTANYVIGPGDELLIRGWGGQIDLDIHARVDRNGTIYIPKVGILNVSGLRFDQLQGFLTSHIGRIYQNFDLTVTMGELRSIDVYVVGQARLPGRYTVSSLSTLTNAVFASGGPAPTGSMRRIQLKRGATIVTELDLYDLLIKGDKSRDVPLQPEDVIYFPAVGPQIAVGGQVNTPAVYELKGETTLAQIFELAGGLTNTPKRLLIIAITVVLSFLIACFVVLVREAIRRKKQDPVEAQRLATLNQYLRSSF